MRLARLQGLEREKIEAEYKELCEKIAYYKELLADEKKLMGVIKDELLEIKKKWGDKRRTKIVNDSGEMDIEDLIEEKQVAITLTHLGYLKRIPADTYKTQKRGGKGITGLTTRENDFVRDLIMCSTHDELMFFTNTGKVHKIRAYEIPEATRTAKGTPAVNFLNLMQRERITTIIPFRDFRDDKYLIAVTKKGTIKKTAISAVRYQPQDRPDRHHPQGRGRAGGNQADLRNGQCHHHHQERQVHLLLGAGCTADGQDRRRRARHQAGGR